VGRADRLSALRHRIAAPEIQSMGRGPLVAAPAGNELFALSYRGAEGQIARVAALFSTKWLTPEAILRTSGLPLPGDDHIQPEDAESRRHNTCGS
jgi:hypothetical protein